MMESDSGPEKRVNWVALPSDGPVHTFFVCVRLHGKSRVHDIIVVVYDFFVGFTTLVYMGKTDSQVNWKVTRRRAGMVAFQQTKH